MDGWRAPNGSIPCGPENGPGGETVDKQNGSDDLGYNYANNSAREEIKI